MCPIVIAIIGSRNSGKSTFTVDVCNTITILDKKVSIIKFSHSHYSFEPHVKDTAIFSQSTAKDIIFTGPFETVFYRKTNTRLSLEDLNKFISKGTEFVLCESYPSNHPVIPSIYTIKGKTDYFETKARYKGFLPFMITGIYACQNTGFLEGIPVLSMNNRSDLQKIVELILNQEDKHDLLQVRKNE